MFSGVAGESSISINAAVVVVVVVVVVAKAWVCVFRFGVDTASLSATKSVLVSGKMRLDFGSISS